MVARARQYTVLPCAMLFFADRVFGGCIRASYKYLCVCARHIRFAFCRVNENYLHALSRCVSRSCDVLRRGDYCYICTPDKSTVFAIVNSFLSGRGFWCCFQTVAILLTAPENLTFYGRPRFSVGERSGRFGPCTIT